MTMLLYIFFALLLTGTVGLVAFDRYIRREQQAWLDSQPIGVGLRRARWRSRA